MAINWSPNSPDKLGVELLDMGYGHQAISAPNHIAVQNWEASRTGQIDDVQFYSATSGNQSAALDDRYNGLRRPMIVDLVTEGNELSDEIQIDQYEVTTVTGGTGMINENFSTPINPNRLQTSNDGLFIAAGAIGAVFNANFDTSAYPLTRHVVAVEPVMRINLTTGVRRVDPVGLADSPWYYNIPMFSPSFVLASVRMGETIVDGSDSVWSHWTPDMIREFASASGRYIRISCQAGPGYWRIDRLALRVYSITERRRGVGIGSPTNNTWVNFDMQTPNATGSPSVTSGERLSWMIRRIGDYSVDSVAAGTALAWRVFRGNAPVFEDWRRLNLSLDPINGIGTVRTLDNGTVEDDSVPYHLSRGVRVYDGQNASQTITVPAGSTEYGQAFVVAGWIPEDGFPNHPLRCEVYRVSDGVRVLEPVEITADDVSRLPVSAPDSNIDDVGAFYKTLRFRFPESVDLSTGSHEIRISSPGTSESRPWHIGCLLGTTHSDDQTYGGTTSAATGEMIISSETVNVTGAGYTADLLVQLVTVPAAVTGVATAEGSLTVHHASVCDVNRGCDGCADEALPYTALSWSAAPTGTPEVVAYQVDREDDLSPDWERVATIWGRTNTTWQDHEARIGVQSRYRVRVVRDDEVTGDWSDTVSITIPKGQVALSMTSNAATGMGCLYPEIWTNNVVKSFDFEESSDVKLSTIFGRDKHVAFRPLERRGDGFTRTVLLSAMCTVALPTMSVFQPLRDLAWAPVPYVCVRDGEGNRWFATLRVTNGRQQVVEKVGTLVYADVDVIEVAAEPSVYDSETSPVTGVINISDVL